MDGTCAQRCDRRTSCLWSIDNWHLRSYQWAQGKKDNSPSFLTFRTHSPFLPTFRPLSQPPFWGACLRWQHLTSHVRVAQVNLRSQLRGAKTLRTSFAIARRSSSTTDTLSRNSTMFLSTDIAGVSRKSSGTARMVSEIPRKKRPSYLFEMS